MSLYGRVAGKAHAMFKSTKRKAGPKKGQTAAEIEEFGTELASFQASYLGSAAVKQEFGNDVCKAAVDQIMSLDQPERAVTLLVTPKGIFLRDAKTRETVRGCPIDTITFVSMDADNATQFSFITQNQERKLLLCHGFIVESRVSEIPTAVNQAFMISSGSSDAPEPVVKSEADAALEEELAQEDAAEGRSPAGSVVDKRASVMLSDRADAQAVYSAKYLGSVPVDEPRGNEIVVDAVKRIRTLAQLPRAVEIVITDMHIEIADAKTNEVLRTVPIMEVSFTALDPKDKKLFSYITNDPRLGIMQCHAFSVRKDKAEEIPITIAASFKLAKQTLQDGDVQRLQEIGLLPKNGVGKGSALGMFEAKYLGGVNALGTSGNYVVDAAIKEVNKLGNIPVGVVLVVNTESLRTVEGLTGSLLSSVLVSTVSFIATAGPKKTTFAFITHDVKLSKDTCHLYECPNAIEISRTIGGAFQAAKELHELRRANPFAATSLERRAIKGPLFSVQLHRSDLEAVQPIGSGQFGQVFLGLFKGNKVAVKEVRESATESEQEEFKGEAETMLDLDHENLVKLLGVSMQQTPWLCVIEYMQYGDLRAVVQTCRDRMVMVTKYEQLSFCRQLASGMAYLAEHRYIHMDLAARNVLLAGRNKVKLADFGLTRKLDPGKDTYILRKTAKLPIRWMAIECLTHKVFSQASDVWAFGIVMWEVASYGVLPFHDVHNVDVQKEVLKGLRLVQPAGCDDDYFLICRGCWQLAPQRPTFSWLEKKLGGMMRVAQADCPPERDVGALALGGRPSTVPS